MSRIALYTFGLLKAPTGSDILVDFVATAPLVFAEADAIDGFLGHAGAARPDLAGKAKFGEDFGPWGIAVAPRFYQSVAEPGEETMIATLSFWRNIEIARRFSYGGLHRAALKRRSDWFHKAEWPGYVLWWVQDDKIPTWAEGARNLETLADDGATNTAFNFAACFDEAGRKIAT